MDSRRYLPLLDGLRVTSPCDERWEDFAGDGAARRCARCERDVLSVPDLTAADVAAWALLRGGSLRLRVAYRADGSVITADPPPPPRDARASRASLRLPLALGAALALTAPAVARAQDAGAPAAQPAADSDGDGVPDAVDACPTTPGVPSTVPSQNGCPPASRAVQVGGGPIRIAQELYFAAGSASLEPASRHLLEALADLLRRHPEIRAVEVVGRTDTTPRERRLRDLARRRAEAVRQWLVEHGVEPARLSVATDATPPPTRALRGPFARSRERIVSFRVVSR